MTKRLGLAMCVLGMLCGSSCTYLKHRTNDLLDVFWVDLDAGLLASAEVRVTDFFATGGGVSVQTQPIFNLHGRYCGNIDRFSGGIPCYWLINMYQVKQTDNMQPCIEGSGVYSLDVQPPPVNYLFCYPGEFFVGRANYSYGVRKRGWRVADVAVGGSFLLGLRVGLSPGELLDFVAGIFGVDLVGDDAIVHLGAEPGRNGAAAKMLSHGAPKQTKPTELLDR